MSFLFEHWPVCYVFVSYIPEKKGQDLSVTKTGTFIYV